jgi:DNA polymerase-3 subunit epsilon
LREIVFDTETTGLDRKFHRLVSLAGVELVEKMPTGRFVHFYLNPDRESDPRALEIHGLTSDFLRTKPRFSEVAISLIDFVAGDPLVIHNAEFDIGFLNTELTRMGLGRHLGRTVCTKCMAQRQFGRGGGGTGANYSYTNRLDDLVKRFGIRDLRSELGAHGALVDCLLLVNVYRSLSGLPVVEFDLSPYMDVTNGRKSERSSEGPGLSQAAQAVAIGGGAGSSSGGAEQELRGNDRVSDASQAGGAESAVAASRGASGGGQLGSLT